MDKYANEAVKTLHDYQFGVRADPTSKYATWGEPGRADLMCVRGGRGLYIEIKYAPDRFLFDSLRENQREWAEKYARSAPFSTEVWLWLIMGSNPPHWNPEKYKPRKHWLIPYPAWFAIENDVSQYQKSLPYRVGKHHDRNMQEHQYDAITLLARWELHRIEGCLHIPVGHPFYEMYIGQPPLPLYTEEKEMPCRIASPLPSFTTN